MATGIGENILCKQKKAMSFSLLFTDRVCVCVCVSATFAGLSMENIESNDAKVFVI